MALRCPPGLELRDVDATEVAETIRRGRRLVSRKVGLIRRVVETRYQAQDPVVFSRAVVPADFSRCVTGGAAVDAGGTGETATVALASAIGETVERHCACLADRDRIVCGSFRELAADAVSPDLLRLFSREQIEQFAPDGPDYFDEDTRIAWVWGYSLTAGRPRLVPATLVYLNHQRAPEEAFIGLNASTGLASGATREEAILSGLLETVERDAFTIAWMRRHAGRRIEIDDEETARILRVRLWADRPGVQATFYDLTTDVPIPVVLLIMRRQAECGPVVCLGAASRLSPRHAMRKCIQEAGQNFPYLRHLLESEKDWQPAPDFSNLVNFDYHFLNYLKRPELVPGAFAFFDGCQHSVALSRLPDRSTGRVLTDLEYCVASLEHCGYEAIVTDITTPEISDVGLSVVRVIVPGLVPLHGHHLRPFLGVRRLFDVPARAEWQRHGWTAEAGLNPFPHPFP
jgi:ribosomal protein S12 methylthiotransferase accessory factor